MMFALPALLYKTSGWTGDVAQYCALSLAKCTSLYSVPPPAILSSATALWLDAADESTLDSIYDAPTELDRVLQWNDKSGNNRHATAITSNRSPYYVNFSGYNWLFFGDGNCLKIDTSFFVGNNFSIFIVYKPLLLSSSRQTIFSNGNNDATNVFNIEVNASRGITALRLNTSMIGVNNNIIDEVNIFEYERNGTANRLRKSGTLLSNNTSATNYANSNQPSLIGARRITPFTQPLTGLIGELIITSANLSSTNRELIEGYLAWKWGLQTGLPIAHPFLTTPPAGTVFDRTVCFSYKQIDYLLLKKQDLTSYCELFMPEVPPPDCEPDARIVATPDIFLDAIWWLDASDDDSLQNIGVGDRVFEWIDKTGYGRSGLQSTALNRPSLNADSLGRSISFDDENALILDNSVPANTYIFYVAKRTVFSGSDLISIFANSGLNAGLTGGVVSSQSVSYVRNGTASNVYRKGISYTNSLVYPTGSVFEDPFTFADVYSMRLDFAITSLGELTADGSFQLYEVVGFSSEPSLSERQEIEAYFSWKYFIEDNLDNSHPFKVSSPLVTTGLICTPDISVDSLDPKSFVTYYYQGHQPIHELDDNNYFVWNWDASILDSLECETGSNAVIQWGNRRLLQLGGDYDNNGQWWGGEVFFTQSTSSQRPRWRFQNNLFGLYFDPSVRTSMTVNFGDLYSYKVDFHIFVVFTKEATSEANARIITTPSLYDRAGSDWTGLIPFYTQGDNVFMRHWDTTLPDPLPEPPEPLPNPVLTNLSRPITIGQVTVASFSLTTEGYNFAANDSSIGAGKDTSIQSQNSLTIGAPLDPLLISGGYFGGSIHEILIVGKKESIAEPIPNTPVQVRVDAYEYLRAKWKTHGDDSILPISTWSPPALAIEYIYEVWDTSSLSSMTEVSGKVSAWTSSSNNAGGLRTFLQGTASLRPVKEYRNGITLLRFTNAFMDLDPYDVPTQRLSPYQYVFIVFVKSNSSEANSRLFTQLTGTNTLDTQGIIPAISNGATIGSFYNANQRATKNIIYDPPELMLYEFGFNGNQVYTCMNGGTDSKYLHSSAIDEITRLRIGQSIGGSSAFFNGYIGEIVCLSPDADYFDPPTQLSKANRQKVQGYLAYKWRFQNRLPSNHPYRYNPPSLF